MRKAVQGVLILVLTGILGGCVIAIGNDGFEEERDWRDRQERNNRYLDRLELGERLAVIEADLGEPDFTDTFRRDGETFKVLYYRTRHVHGDGRTSREETTPLVFVEESLVGWGESAVDRATR